ncbi:uncharacterized protein BDZ83DRAFT_620258 [Colletotrichum acutatum]|uniref:Uncharacterized protein n=1 Tax=Glomerella acutata TaxID=27357 RepID=A0AAD8ULY2_GLOAC|nr:uncharacterized protein BDZ83DRAFT_620258 [Colletotrichum acutatum]KAK1725257.1 hypothetical protein BDZ83DRAFT_620258 [Colletotrichum acutatum]
MTPLSPLSSTHFLPYLVVLVYCTVLHASIPNLGGTMQRYKVTKGSRQDVSREAFPNSPRFYPYSSSIPNPHRDLRPSAEPEIIS